MKKTLYLNCYSGISGDMTLGVLLDLLGREDIEPFLAGLVLKNYEVSVSRSKRGGITGLDVRVMPGEDHPHRGLAEIMEIIEKSSIGPGAAARASEAFRLLAEAEAAVHGTSPEKIHFHEVGAVDSIVDIVGACILLEALDPARVVISSLNLGSGTVKCAHGEMPVPAPATAKLLEGVPVFSRGEPMERTTPTGAALARVFASEFGTIPPGVIVRTGYGLGDADTELANVLQGTLLEEADLETGDAHLGRRGEGRRHRH
ncbi:MAG: hypothetical protein BWY01_00429 [Synergistetes bacterium ADurb.Bin155]|jgi:hypothetical protein|nr:LarC family nickel insertion protein [Synergistales bacterium]MBP8996640.1 LarC family nickel insertion protein [Synergistales bacterium]OQB46521.1 MAG: hypothetical protein BWY01_00429 [Synergistetes bacterium ADurb.Bin155]HOC82895.1 LarC family nickel insertion protein [Synergistales bacterium]HQL02486.1 LarC family nickel insertion protein [Synergistales bacterium]